MQYFSWSLKDVRGLASTLRHIPLNMGSKVKNIMKYYEIVVKTLNSAYSI